ncbi:protein Wnt-5a [Folsomia candida]|uniref:protein Wnt-5a n=1 Tax=Folsomia candida TaxID=158441 RepID=UPI000B904768|nr:protein Wnt-5a [Folsomia candida]
MVIKTMHHKAVQRRMPSPHQHHNLIFILSLINILHTSLASHWINLNLWHDELSTWDPEQSISNNVTPIASPGGKLLTTATSGLPGCHELDGLTDGQLKLCLLFTDHMRSVVAGAKLGLSECRWQFRHHHWNCSVLPIQKKTTLSDDKRATTTTTASTIITPQSRILRESKNGNFNPSTRKRKTRNFQNGTENLNLGRDFYSSDPLPTTTKSKKKNRKNHSISNDMEDPSTNNNFVMGGMTKSPTGKRGQQISLETQPASHSHHHHDKEEKAQNWNSILTRGTKEVAFAQAVWSAAVTEAVARSCREGSISSCGCGKTPRPADLKDEWRWGGCGDNLQYGYKFAQNFVDIREQENPTVDKKGKTRSLVNLHNNEAGRRAVLKKTKIACKCHGVSGSCALITCWHQIPTFREIGDYLKVQYEKATQVKLNRRGRLQVKKNGVPVPSVVDLVYTDLSPNYCFQNETLGIYGTSGRICNKTVSSPNSCKNLCCNRGHTSVVAKSGHRCNCKFMWCCQVVCEECRSVQKYDVCK